MSVISLRRAVPAALVGLLCSSHVIASDASRAEGSETPYFEDLPTVLSATRLPQPLHEAPGAVTILDQEFIRNTGYRDLARLLRLVPGMQIGQERGHSQWVTYHGLGSDFPTEIQVLIDGRSVYAPSSFGGVDWSALPLTLDEIERIEVVRGTNSNAYGANAFLGVVNIITRHTQDGCENRLQLRGGTQGVADAEASWSGGNENIGLRVSAAQLRDSGFDGLYDSRMSRSFSLRSDLRVTARDELTLRAGHVHAERQLGYPDSVFGNNAQRQSGTEGNTLHLTWRHSRAEDEEWLLSLYRNEEAVLDRWTAAAPPAYPSVPLDRNRASKRSNAEIQHRFAVAAGTRLVWGLEGRRDETDASFLYGGTNPPSVNLYRAFSNLDWHVSPTWQLNLGALLEKYNGLGAQFIPRSFLNWQATEGDTFRAGYARAWLQRNLFDRYGDVRAYDPASGRLLAWPYVPNPDVRIPRVDTVELGYLGRFRVVDASLDVRVFQERITDFVVREIVPSPAGALPLGLPSSRFVNLASPVVLRGIEYQLRARPWSRGEVMFNHSIIDRRSDDPAVRRRTSPYTASLTWLQDYGKGWRSTASLLRMGPLAGGYGYVPAYSGTARPYTTLDLRVAREMNIDGQRARVAVNAINLGDRHQEIADQSEQAAHPGQPVNPVSPTVWLSLELEI